MFESACVRKCQPSQFVQSQHSIRLDPWNLTRRAALIPALQFFHYHCARDAGCDLPAVYPCWVRSPCWVRPHPASRQRACDRYSLPCALWSSASEHRWSSWHSLLLRSEAAYKRCMLRASLSPECACPQLPKRRLDRAKVAPHEAVGAPVQGVLRVLRVTCRGARGHALPASQRWCTTRKGTPTRKNETR